MNKGQDFVFPNKQKKHEKIILNSYYKVAAENDKRIYFDDDDDDDDDEDEEDNLKSSDTYIRGHYGFVGAQNRGYDKKQNKFPGQEHWKQSKKSEKRSRYQQRTSNQNQYRVKFFDDHIVHFMHNKVN